jgi:hypothetical protein
MSLVFRLSGNEFADIFLSLNSKPMKHLVSLYYNNRMIAFICDGIALIVCAVTVIFTITILTIACAI